MSKTFLPSKIQNYLFELVKRRVISSNSLEDQTFINYLCNQKIDEDYFYMEYKANPKSKKSENIIV